MTPLLDGPAGWDFMVALIFFIAPLAFTLFVAYWVVRVAVRHELRINPAAQPQRTGPPVPSPPPDWHREL